MIKIDLLGNKIQMNDLPNNTEIKNGTIILIDVETVDVRKYKNLKLDHVVVRNALKK